MAKALALRAWDPVDIEIVSERRPADASQLHGGAARRAGELGVTVEISLTHSKGMAGAVAVANP